MKRILLSLGVIMTSVALNAQITNGDLEAWTAGEPDTWMYDFGGQTGVAEGTLNFLAGYGEVATTTEISGADAAGASGSSALLEVSAVVPGGAVETQVGLTEIAGFLFGDFAYTTAATDFSFDLKVNVSANDTAMVQVLMMDAAGTIIGGTGVELTNSMNTTTWTPVTLPISYNDPSVTNVASITIQALASSAVAPVIGSSISVDNFMLSGTASVNENEISALVYPNPASDVLNIELNEVATSVSVVSLDGKVVIAESVNSSNVSVDVSNLVQGAYVYVIETANGTVRNTFVKK